MARTTIVMDDDLQESAKELGINVSSVCREAVEAAIEAKKAALRFGTEFEPVIAWLEDPDQRGEKGQKVRFSGRLIHRDETEADYYVTAGGAPAIVDSDGLLWHTDTLAELGIDEDGYTYQLLAAALGEVVEPVDLDI